MQKKKILIASIVNFIALFLPYASMDFDYNYFLWKNNKSSELVVDWFRLATDAVNMINAILIYVLSISLLVLSLIYLKNKSQRLERLICFTAMANICANLFFCYHIYQLGEYKFMHVGVLLSMTACIYIVVNGDVFDKKGLLIIGAVLVMTFPSLIQMYYETIEAPVEAHCHSFQTYFFVLYSILSFDGLAWLLAVPAMITIYFSFKAVILTIANNKKKVKAVHTMRIWYVLTFVLELFFMITSTEDTYITLTYPLAITLVSIYLYLDKKSNNKEVTIENV